MNKRIALMTSIFAMVIVAQASSISPATRYSLNGETMECRINDSNGIPAVFEKGNHNDALVMTEESNGITVTADYQEGENYILFTYQDTVKNDQLFYTIPFVDLGLQGIIKTAQTYFILGGVKTTLTCNVRAVSSGIPVPPTPKIK
jgi:hypothetical protein